MKRHELIAGRDISLHLLAALATLTPGEREAWINVHMRGEPSTLASNAMSRQANRKLRAYYTTPNNIQEAA